MKRLFSLLMAFIITLSLCACTGNFSDVNLKDPIAIPEDGIIKKTIIEQIQSENAICVFTGNSGTIRYEWTVFSSDIETPKDISLKLQAEKTNNGGISLLLDTTEVFGFCATLSIHLDERWNAQSAAAFADGVEIASVSITGSHASILNLPLDGSFRNITILPSPDPEEEETTAATEGFPEEPTSSAIETEPETEPADTVPSEPPTEAAPEKDKYLTDPVPEGKPNPVEPEDQEVNKGTSYTCTFSIECSTILNNLDMLDPDKLAILPSGGVILQKTTVTFYEGESVFDVLQRLCKEKGIHMEAEWTPIYNSAYVEGIHNLYEFDCGALSGWMYKVNGWYPNYGSSRYQLKDGDVVEWRYTCDLGNDVGGAYAVGG